MKNSNIKSMKLYNHVDRILNEIREMGKKDSQALKADDLINFDQLHYCGIEAVDYCINNLNIDSSMEILEIGSGLGGPARYIASKTKAKIYALELQDDQNKIASNLTKRCGLDKAINHICGDILTYYWDKKKFNCIVSWLTLFHIHEHEKLLKKCFDLLRPNGYFYAEDLIGKQTFSNDELSALSTELYANYLPNFKTYEFELKKNGFKIIYYEDMTDEWANFTKRRKESYLKQRDRHIRVHGIDVFNSLNSFYTFIDKYFSNGKLGGIRVIAKKNDI